MTAEIARPEDQGCRFAEILQFSCEFEKKTLHKELRCSPIPRIFRICRDRPAVEITTLVDLNTKTGEVEIPASARQFILSREYTPKGRLWRDVVLDH
ncbi:hypothetical protein SISNIDRAFT_406208 [Sistotremastrum niveocremeum HHB9708]|uniref:Uncharacterized protein n=1 Tax=Sistotremastrum niveocremeum HHB9708 TaxID=1314777 RepID=A0A164YMR4_9AGAM|nr:hypothetical protein SISNIDRAFT_406208 [Sistotremastrum niveocremeum HHB9708]